MSGRRTLVFSILVHSGRQMDEIEKLTPDIQFLIKVSARPHTLTEALLTEPYFRDRNVRLNLGTDNVFRSP